MESRSSKAIKRSTTLILFLLLILTFGLLGAESVYANWHDITLKPGQTYDCGKADKNTSVYINKPGTYTLKGTSRYVRVVICCGDVKCYLDGVNLNAGIYTHIGQAAAPMNIVEDGGTVRLISKKGTYSYFEGYMCPAICKEGMNTELVFETEDPDDPGEIEAVAGSAGAAAIGCTQEIQYGKKSCGNITINSGKVTARIKTSQDEAAAIGGGSCCSGKFIRINGGEVEAFGSKAGAGIGGGSHGNASNIEVNGGKVYAETRSGGGAAAIGSGGMTSSGASPGVHASQFYFRGGEVTAISRGTGAAIGGGANNGVSNLHFIGGTIEAKNTNHCVAIGAGYGYSLTFREIWFRGADVTATTSSSYPAIGASEPPLADNNTGNIGITGGSVVAKGGEWDIGGGIDNVNTEISGGTVQAEAIKGHLKIKGGSVYTDTVHSEAHNDKDEVLHRVDVSFNGVGDGIAISDPGYAGEKYSYGMRDVKTINEGMFYPWLPKENNDSKLKTAYLELEKDKKTIFYGSIPFKEDSGTMNQATRITLETESHSQGESGSADGIPGEKELWNLKKPGIPSKEIPLKYTDANGNEVADMDGKLYPNVPGITNASGEWICDEPEKTLYCRTRPFQYKIHFDSNAPRNASTKGHLSGQMSDMTGCNYGEEIKLTANAFRLPGYDFDSWNTKADGTGTRYADQDGKVKNLSDKDGGYAALYAQWNPKTYKVTLDPGMVSGSQVQTDSIVFDSELEIPEAPEAWVDEYRSFHCWKDEDGNLYDSGDHTTNLCTLDTNGDPQGKTLTAVWAEHGKVAATVTKNGKPVTGMENCFKLFAMADGTEFDPVMTYSDGVYTFDSVVKANDGSADPENTGQTAELESGEYTLVFDTETDAYLPMQAEIAFEKGRTASVVFDYYTVSIEADVANSGITSVMISPAGGMIIPVTDNTVNAPDDAELVIGSASANGYHFDGYSVLGVSPQTKNYADGVFNSSAPRQTVVVRGKADIMAHAAANVYSVHFDSNAGPGVTGEMADQDMVYDEPQDLFANQFERTGGTFTEWNAAKDGSGESYTDRQNVSNLTTNDEVSLYAQWDMEQYNINYDLDGGQLPGGAQNPTRYTAADDSFTLIDPEWPDDTHAFAGWIGTGCQAPTKEVTIEEGSTGDRYYIAAWSEIDHLVRFDTGDGSYVETQTVTVHQKAVKPDDPTRDHYTFAGWYADKELTTEFDFNQEITQDTTVYAKWDHIEHDITYDLNGGTLDGKTGQIIVKANEGDVITIMDAPTRNGYTFDYWKGSEYYPGDKYLVEEDHTLTAMWKQDKNDPDDPDGPDDPDDPDDPDGPDGPDGPDDPDDPADSDDDNHSGGSSTGDENNLTLWLLLMLTSGAGVLAAVGYRKRKSEDRR